MSTPTPTPNLIRALRGISRAMMSDGMPWSSEIIDEATLRLEELQDKIDTMKKEQNENHHSN
jgi:hypothetical protein